MADSRFEQARDHFLAGVARQEAAQWAEAEAQYRASLALLPDRPSTLANLGAVLVQAGRAAEALPLLARAATLDPADVQAVEHQALALVALQRDAEALQAFDTALRLGRHGAALHWQHTLCLVRLGRLDAAHTACQPVLQARPDDAAAWALNGSLLKDLGRAAEASTALRRAIALGADPGVNGYLLASLDGRQAPPHPPPGYVQGLFDGYAEGFDSHLLHTLQYRAHTALGQQVQASGHHFASALDLGCGTGLCGPLIKPLVQQLTGVDLSGAMLEQARARGVYDSLLQDDITAHLAAAAPAQHALVLAADVFIYVGALDAVFAGVHRVLQDGGLFCFSAEWADDAVDFTLRPSSRYAHSSRYLLRLAQQHGFSVQRAWQEPVRAEQGRPVAGLYLSLVRIP